VRHYIALVDIARQTGHNALIPGLSRDSLGKVIAMAVDEPVRTGTIGQPLETISNVSLTEDERTWGSLCHFAGFFGVLGPLICWIIKKDTSKWVDEQGKSALNFQITNLIIGVVSVITIFGPFAVHIYSVIFSILAGLKVKEGVPYKYPFSLNLIK
jgi:uncharacterized protein